VFANRSHHQSFRRIVALRLLLQGASMREQRLSAYSIFDSNVSFFLLLLFLAE
jgi:hypothetical protein